jgi:hypothetical protein
MNIAHLDNGTAEISMPDYLKESIPELGENVNKTATTPSKRDLYKNCEKSKCSRKARARFSTASLQSYCMYPIGDVWTFSC